MTTDDALAGFESGWQQYNGISERHRRKQVAALRRLQASAGDLLSVGAVELRTHLEERVTAGLSAATVGQNLAEIRPFYTWAFQHELIDATRYLAIRGVKPPRNLSPSLPRPYTERERGRFWRDFDRAYPWVQNLAEMRPYLRTEAANTEERGRAFFERWMTGRSRWSRARPYCRRLQTEAIVKLAMVAGLRRIEIYRLEVGEPLDPDSEYLIVEGARKGNGQERERAVPWLTQDLRDSVEKWLGVRAEILAVEPRVHTRPWLYLTANGCGSGERDRRPPDWLSFPSFQAIPHGIGPWQWHRMRHTAATEMLRAGYPVTSVQKILGHADISMTMRYVKLLREDIVHSARINQANYERRMRRER